MATTEDIDEAEQLRCLALKSMVKRSIRKNSKIKSEETDDQDILLLRAAALKTINHKKNTKNGLLVDKNPKLIKNKLPNGKKRTHSYNKVSKIKKKIKSNEIRNKRVKNNITVNIIEENTQKELLFEDLKFDPEIKQDNVLKSKSNTESQVIPTADTEDAKKIIRNGSIQLSNLDSDKYNETMVLEITFSSSESEDSSNDCDVTKPNMIIQEDDAETIINTDDLIPQVSVNCSSADTVNITTIDHDRFKNLMQKLVELMQHCENDIENRDQQIKIILEAYSKYQNYSKSMYSIIELMKEIRAELANDDGSLDIIITE